MNWALFVEGKSDKVFVQWLLERLSIDSVQVNIIGGGVSKLGRAANEILKSHNDGRHIAILLDANSNVQDRRNELAKEIERLSLPIEGTFLLPDDRGEGELETLLERMAPATHQAVYDCLDKYKECLRSLDATYTPPGQKARVYAYCEAIGAETKPEKDYDVPTHWNLDAPALEPLRQFLCGMVD